VFHIAEVEKHSVELSILVSELDAFQHALYPAESNHCLDLTTIQDEHIRCILVRDLSGYSVGCGALFFSGDGCGEIKRVYIRPAFRGKKQGERILARLEKLAIGSDCKFLRLETGIHQQPAIALYQQCGYEQCEPFPPYKEDPLSVFMSKSLSLESSTHGTRSTTNLC